MKSDKKLWIAGTQASNGEFYATKQNPSSKDFDRDPKKAFKFDRKSEALEASKIAIDGFVRPYKG